MADNFPEKTSLETLARKYAMKGEKIYIDGPVHYKGNTYWAIFYEMKKLLKKPMRTCVIVTDLNQRIVTDKDVFKEIAQAFLLPRPNTYFKGIHEEEKKDLLGIQRYFDPENYVLDLDLLQFIEKSKKLNLPGVSKALDDVINHYEKISEIVEKILDVKEEVGELLKNMIENEFIQVHVEKFLNLVVVKEGNLIKDLLKTFYVERELLQKLKDELEKEKSTKALPKDFERLLEDTKHGIKAIDEVDKYLKQLVKARVDIQNLYKNSWKSTEKFYNEMLNRIKTK